MVVRLLDSKDSEQIANYNGRKLKAMNARIVCESIPGALKMIHKYESSDFLTAKARNLGEHLTISPGIKDKMDENSLKLFTKKLTQKLNIGDQPWVLIEHTDIVRKHYHFFFTRARKDGTVCSSAYLKHRVFTAAKEVCEEMHIFFGVSDDIDFPSIEKYEKSTGYITVQYRALLNKVLGENPASWQEFQDKMLSRNVKVTKGKKSNHLIFKGLGPDGKPDVAPVYNLDKGGAMLDKVERCISEVKDGINRMSRNDDIEGHSFLDVEQTIIHLTTVKDVDSAPAIPKAILNPLENTSETEEPAVNTESEAIRPVKTTDYPSSFRITPNKLTITEEVFIDEEQEDPEQTLPEEHDDLDENFSLPTAESIAKKIKQRIREANSRQELENKLKDDGIGINPYKESYESKWTLGVFAFDSIKGKVIEIPDDEIRTLLTPGEKRLLCDESEWLYYEENLTGERDLQYGAKRKFHI